MLLLKNIRPMAGDATDMLLANGRIAAIGPGLQAPSGAAVEDGGGAIAVPGLVEAHTHLDKSLIGLPWYKNEVGPRLIDKIDNERLNKRRLNMDPTSSPSGRRSSLPATARRTSAPTSTSTRTTASGASKAS